MESERERIQKLLDDRKISPVEAEKLFQALEEKKGEESKPLQTGDRNRNLLLLLIGSVVIVIILYIAFSGPEDGEANLLLNPGFERGADGRVASWAGGASYGGGDFLGGSKEGTIFFWDANVSHQGRRSVAIVNTEGGGRKALSWRQQIKSFPAGKKLRLSGYLRSRDVSAKGTAAIVLRGLRGLKEETFIATTAMSYDLTGTKDWTAAHLQVVVGDGTEELQILCELEGSGTLWCDDLELRVVE